ncbi:MAG: hypothetical protein ACJAU4_000889 [Glaciecola sp.]|jgi:hypothetical protein
MDSNIKNIIEIIETLESRINSYWNFYIIAVFAVIGWLMAAGAAAKSMSGNQGIALIIAVVIFLFANILVIRAATKRMVAFEAELNAVSKQQEFKSQALKQELSRTSMKNRLNASYLLHVIVDIALLYAIWSKLFM